MIGAQPIALRGLDHGFNMMVWVSLRRHLIDAFYPRVSEWTAAGVIVALAYVLSDNTGLMARATSATYAQLLEWASQEAWAVGLTVLGLARIVILMINGFWRRTPVFRAGAAFLSCVVWTQLVLSFAPTYDFAYVSAWGFLVMDIVNIFRAMQDARVADDAYSVKRTTREDAP